MGARISAPIQTDRGVHPDSCTMSTECLSRGLSGIDHPLPSSAEVKETVELYLYSLSGSPWPGLGRTLRLLSVYIVESVNIKTYQSVVVSSVISVGVKVSLTHSGKPRLRVFENRSPRGIGWT